MCRKFSLVCLAVLLGILTATAQAGGGFGSVWTQKVTCNSIRIKWSNPSGRLRHASSPHRYKICYKKCGEWVGACSGGTVVYTGSKPYTISGLEEDQCYKIKVFTYTQRKNLWGRWVNPKYRKVGTLSQSTKECAPPPVCTGYLTAEDAGERWLDVKVEWSNTCNFDLVRVGYKKTWWLTSLKWVCSDRDRPAANWGASSAWRGWKDIPVPGSSPITVRLNPPVDLLRCKQYKIVAYGFSPGSTDGQLLGEVKMHTQGCWWKTAASSPSPSVATSVASLIVEDHDCILSSYASEMNRFYLRSEGKTLFEHIADQNPELYAEQAILQLDDEDFNTPLDTIAYVLSEHPDIFDAFQTEVSAAAPDLILVSILAESYPVLYNALLEEVNEPAYVGHILAWGYNSYGQADAPGGNDFVAITAGGMHNLALKAYGSVVACGSNSSGQSNVPADNNDFVAITAGDVHSLALKSDGSIEAWGNNAYGQSTPPAYNNDFVAIAAGQYHNLGLKSDGSIVAWGWNMYGQTDVPPDNNDFVDIAAGAFHSLALKSDGSIVAWGNNSSGQCDVPADNNDFVDIAGGRVHSLALKYDGSVHAWGHNGFGQCNVPADNNDFIAVAGGSYHSLALTVDGSIVAWGDNGNGQCNVPADNNDFVAIACGDYHSLALRENVFFDLDHCALGEAQVTKSPMCTVVVTNIGSSGEDGVAIELPQNLAYWAADVNLGDPYTTPDGAFFGVTSRGVVDGIPDQIVSVVHYEDAGDQIAMSIVFPTLEPNSLTAEYYLDGNLVLTEENIDPCDAAGTWYWPPSWFNTEVGVQMAKKKESEHFGRVISLTPEVNASVGGVAFVMTTPDGNTVNTDALVVRAVGCAVAFDGYNDVSLTAKDIPSFSITNEVVQLPCAEITGDINEDCIVNFYDFAIFARFWLEDAAPSPWP